MPPRGKYHELWRRCEAALRSLKEERMTTDIDAVALERAIREAERALSSSSVSIHDARTTARHILSRALVNHRRAALTSARPAQADERTVPFRVWELAEQHRLETQRQLDAARSQLRAAFMEGRESCSGTDRHHADRAWENSRTRRMLAAQTKEPT